MFMICMDYDLKWYRVPTTNSLLSCQFHDHSDVLLLLLLFSLSYMQWRKKTALMLASEGGHLDVVRELLKAQADVNAQDWVCIFLGVCYTLLVAN